jgi:ribosomal protein S27AE
MSAIRPNQPRSAMTLDEQSFEGLLSAAFTIQEHNKRRTQTQPTVKPVAETVEPVVESAAETDAAPEPEPSAVPLQALPETHRTCPHCGAAKADEAGRCGNCGLEEFRPGERLQRNWASMWLKSQEQGLWPERSPEHGETIRKIGESVHQELPPVASQGASRIQAENHFTGPVMEPTVRDESRLGQSALGRSALGQSMPGRVTDEQPIEESRIDVQSALGGALEKAHWNSDAHEPDSSEAVALDTIEHEDAELDIQPHDLPAEENVAYLEAADTPSEADSLPLRTSILPRLADIRVTLRFHRADLYLGLAVFVALVALLWPAASAPKRASLSLWERALVTMGIAEAPAPVIHLQGDPSIEVWVDPHTALYYCPGAEPFGKTKDGRLSSQRDAQLDRFEPASRSACE